MVWKEIIKYRLLDRHALQICIFSHLTCNKNDFKLANMVSIFQINLTWVIRPSVLEFFKHAQMWLNYCHCSLHFVFINLHFFKQNGISSSLCSNRALHYVCKTNLSYKKVSQTFQWSVYSVMWYSIEYMFPIYLNSVGSIY